MLATRNTVFVSEALFQAAAKAPLEEAKNGGEIAFDVRELLEAALEEAPSSGRAWHQVSGLLPPLIDQDAVFFDGILPTGGINHRHCDVQSPALSDSESWSLKRK